MTKNNSDAKPSRKKVIVVGAGFGGLNAAKRLGAMDSVDVTVVDRHNYHLFQPLLYQVAMAGLNSGEIATPIRSVLSKYNHTNVLLGGVTAIDLKNNELTADFGTLKYDYLVLACGSQHSYFGNDQWEPFAPPLKTLEQAGEIRRRVLSAFELA
jgi:NADH dehydrogenase